MERVFFLSKQFLFIFYCFLCQFIRIPVYNSLNVSDQLLNNLVESFFRIIIICLMVFVSNSHPFSWISEECLTRKLNNPKIKKLFYIIIFVYLILFFLIELIIKEHIIGSYLPAPVFSYVIRYLVGAILEELLFKTFIFRALKTETSLPLITIGIMTSVLFSLLHTQYYSFPLALFEISLWEFFSILLFNY